MSAQLYNMQRVHSVLLTPRIQSLPYGYLCQAVAFYFNSLFCGEGARCNAVLSSTYLQHELNDPCAVFQFAQTTFRSDFTERCNYFHHNCVHSGLLIKPVQNSLLLLFSGSFCSPRLWLCQSSVFVCGFICCFQHQDVIKQLSKPAFIKTQ